jgi:hypothetical protein
MKHVTYSEKSLFVDDELAELLIEYARLISQSGEADTVSVPAIGQDGNVVRAEFLLTPSTILMVESADADLEAPGDSDTAALLRMGIDRLSATNVARPMEDGPVDGMGTDFG